MPIKILFCYAREDEALLNKLQTHLKPLQREGLIDIWYDREIKAGEEWEREIDKHLNLAQIILLLVSPDFLDSDYCYGIVMKRAIERHNRKEVKVIPIILRPVHWHIKPLATLQALPTDGKPVISWPHLDDAFYIVTKGILEVVKELNTKYAMISQLTPSKPMRSEQAQNASKLREIKTATSSSTSKIDNVPSEQSFSFPNTSYVAPKTLLHKSQKEHIRPVVNANYVRAKSKQTLRIADGYNKSQTLLQIYRHSWNTSLKKLLVFLIDTNEESKLFHATISILMLILMWSITVFVLIQGSITKNPVLFLIGSIMLLPSIFLLASILGLLD